MKKVYCAVFATFVGLVAFSVPAMAQAICGTSAAAGMSMCTSSQGGNCCVPPRGGMANMSTTIRGQKPVVLKPGKTNTAYVMPSVAAAEQHTTQNNAPADMSNGNGGGANPTPSTPSVNKVQGQAPANVAPAMASGPIVPSSSVKPASAAKAAPAAAAAAPAASASAAKGGAARSGGAKK